MKRWRFYLPMSDEEPEGDELAGEAGGDGGDGNDPAPPCGPDHPDYPNC
ncbi:hypothetical protein GQ464_009525 [Rhodocaloribacter litoris]|nr:hypothetical protein [Rhodocaloribacter litoris]QXD13718.1 hypothetical protein GQ464_009525 [Rhodocaloribacter litoris]GIV61039.1 MAG: hypothetical protein KatS3mg043_2128 [Rhodothermaceae bacterium]